MENKVYISRTDVLHNGNVYERLYNAVSEERRRKIDRLVQKRDKMLSMGAEILLKRALSDCGIEDFSLKYGKNGKPYLADDSSGHIERTALIFELCETWKGEFSLEISYRADSYSEEFIKNMANAFI